MATNYQEQGDTVNSENEIGRQDIQSAIAKAVELRALHAALVQGNSPSNLRFPSASPLSRHASSFSAQDYPVFTPSYDDEQVAGYQQSYAESWGEGGGNVDESDYRTPNLSSRKGFFFPSESRNFEVHICPAENHQDSIAANNNNNYYYFNKSRRNSMGDIRSVSSCNKCKPAKISSDSESVNKNGRKSNIVVPLTDSHSSLHSQPRNRGLSWLFPKLKKKKNKSTEGTSGICQETEQLSQMLKELGIVSVEKLKKELMDANQSRDAALTEAAEMKSSLGELNQKLEYLETYCQELKKALKQQSMQQVKGEKSFSMPVTEEVMVEGFLQIVSEARLSVKQFCKTFVTQIDETDVTLVDNVNALLQPYKLSLSSKYSKAVLYHLEAVINQSLYTDFENSVFQRNGATKILDPQQDRESRFQSFVALRNLSWNEVLRKGTKYYSEELSKFCDEKMSGIIAILGCTRPWNEQLLQAFFVAAKCVWLLHLLAFSFKRPLGILRVEENVVFEGKYMEDVYGERQRSEGPSRVKIMVMPGFYVLDTLLRCKVLCRYKSMS